MKKKLMGIVTIIAIAAVAGYNVYASRSNVKLSDLALANVEALAFREDDSEGSQSDCNTYCMVSYFDTCIIRYTNNTFTTCYDSRIRRSN